MNNAWINTSVKIVIILLIVSISLTIGWIYGINISTQSNDSNQPNDSMDTQITSHVNQSKISILIEYEQASLICKYYEYASVYDYDGLMNIFYTSSDEEKRALLSRWKFISSYGELENTVINMYGSDAWNDIKDPYFIYRKGGEEYYMSFIKIEYTPMSSYMDHPVEIYMTSKEAPVISCALFGAISPVSYVQTGEGLMFSAKDFLGGGPYDVKWQDYMTKIFQSHDAYIKANKPNPDDIKFQLRKDLKEGEVLQGINPEYLPELPEENRYIIDKDTINMVDPLNGDNNDK